MEEELQQPTPLLRYPGILADCALGTSSWTRCKRVPLPFPSYARWKCCGSVTGLCGPRQTPTGTGPGTAPPTGVKAWLLHGSVSHWPTVLGFDTIVSVPLTLSFHLWSVTRPLFPSQTNSPHYRLSSGFPFHSLTSPACLPFVAFATPQAACWHFVSWSCHCEFRRPRHLATAIWQDNCPGLVRGSSCVCRYTSPIGKDEGQQRVL